MIAAFLELFTQRIIIFDDAIMDDHNRSIRTDMGMGILFGRFPMCRPARMSHADSAGELPLGEFTCQPIDFALPADTAQMPILQHGHSCRVIAAILQAVQALNQNRQGLLMPNITDDSTHRLTSMLEDVARIRS